MTQAKPCKICGRPVPTGQRVLCGRRQCTLENAWEWRRKNRWERKHCSAPLPERQTRPDRCQVCGKALNNQSGPIVRLCGDWCRRVHNAERSLAYYWSHHELVLERQAGYRRAKAALEVGQ